MNKNTANNSIFIPYFGTAGLMYPACLICKNYCGYDEHGNPNWYCINCDPIPVPTIKPVSTAG